MLRGRRRADCRGMHISYVVYDNTRGESDQEARRLVAVIEERESLRMAVKSGSNGKNEEVGRG